MAAHAAITLSLQASAETLGLYTKLGALHLCSTCFAFATLALLVTLAMFLQSSLSPSLVPQSPVPLLFLGQVSSFVLLVYYIILFIVLSGVLWNIFVNIKVVQHRLWLGCHNACDIQYRWLVYTVTSVSKQRWCYSNYCIYCSISSQGYSCDQRTVPQRWKQCRCHTVNQHCVLLAVVSFQTDMEQEEASEHLSEIFSHQRGRETEVSIGLMRCRISTMV